MYVYVLDNGMAVFQTPYDEKYDMVQKFRGLGKHSVDDNGPVDFVSVGLAIREKEDAWHPDIPFALTTDEAVPCRVNDAWIGANHGQPCCIDLYAPKHGKTISDVGSVWKDEKGVLFTLLRVLNEDYLQFVSENVGTKTDYRFVMHIADSLTYISNGENKEAIQTDGGQKLSLLNRAYRFTKKRLIGIRDGQEKVVNRYMECDKAKIEEEYEIINPATVAPALTAARPEGGYMSPPDLGNYGEVMIRHHMVYHILEDGTVLCDFEVEKCMDVHFERWMGAMFQERQDVFGGSIWRYLPKTLPITCPEGEFDFSVPYDTAPGPFPKTFHVTPEFWENPASPPDRVVDYLRDEKGHDRLGFVCGFLPLYDGLPEKRLEHLEHSIMLYHSRKVYPTFMSGDITKTRGIAYRRFFEVEKDRASYYTVQAEGKTFLYADFFEENTLEIPICGSVHLYEKSDGISFSEKDGTLTVSGDKGYAVFICEEQ